MKKAKKVVAKKVKKIAPAKSVKGIQEQIVTRGWGSLFKYQQERVLKWARLQLDDLAKRYCRYKAFE